ncbi:MAG: gluconate 2-dehydrogenase subunit 3 family protein [Vicinamibacteria bacterium]
MHGRPLRREPSWLPEDGAVAAAATAVACGEPGLRFRVLTDAEAATLAAACGPIVPPDEDPGAVQAGVVVFVDRQLATRQKKELGSGGRGCGASTRPPAAPTARASPSSPS